jgi:hypothetical protein
MHGNRASTNTDRRRPTVRAGPFLSCLVDTDGRIIVRGIPIVTEAFNVEGFVNGIIEAFRPLRSSDYEFFAGELKHHAEVMGEGLLWSVIHDKTTQQVGIALGKIAGKDFGGCTIERLSDRHPVYGAHWKLCMSR